MATFILTEADEEQIPKTSRIKALAIESDKNNDGNDDQPTQSMSQKKKKEKMVNQINHSL